MSRRRALLNKNNNNKCLNLLSFIFILLNNYTVPLTLSLLLVQGPQWIHAQDFACCSHATGTCRSVCEKISLVDVAASRKLREETMQEVQNYCSPGLVPFWECLNATFQDIAMGESWSGRFCCKHPQSINCRDVCVTAASTMDLMMSCRRSDEIDFFECLERQSLGDSCCGHSNTEECRDACIDIFRTDLTPTKQQRTRVYEQCEQTSPKVWNCVKNFTKVTPATNVQKHLKCCDKSNKSKCRESCVNVLSTTTTHQEIIDGLIDGGCGNVLFHDPFWQCLIQPQTADDNQEMAERGSGGEVSRIDRVGMDSAKGHCCQMANSHLCRKLCSKTFSRDWMSSYEEFNQKCLLQMSEEELRTCIDEVDKPCELGCDGLSFCTNFNNRPTELFRSCNSVADEEARNDVQQWQNNKELILPGVILSLKNITECSPNLWKAVACTIHIKPCSRRSHGNQICREACLNILRQCVDWTRMSPEHNPESICATFSPQSSSDSSCINLNEFLTPPQQILPPNSYQRNQNQVSSPCKGDPCESNEICTVNRNYQLTNKAYTCQPGCKLGEISEYTVPEGTYVRIPMPNNPKGCLKICKCTNGKINDCQPLPCVSLDSCIIRKNQQEHGSTFKQECNTCSCYAGEIICSKKQCENTALSGRNTAYTSLPCNCPPHYVPVCGRNGNNYPSLCLAKCAGLNDSDIEYETCPNPCKSNPCQFGEKCVPDPKVCLSLMRKPCTQYQCINGSSKCGSLAKEPVCSVDNRQYDNACYLAHNNAKLAYRGPCLQNCRHNSGEVCGINGKTYISECAAYSDYISVDYNGPCVTIGLIKDHKAKQCPNIKCKPLPKENCLGFTPPGACCPICGGAIRLLYSRKQIDRALYVLMDKSTHVLTLKSLLKALDRQIQVAQCELRGYLTVELDIFVLVQSTETHPSDLQLEACIREAEKIASLVNRQSPRIASELTLSSLTSATIVHTQSNSSPTNQFQPITIILLISLQYIFVLVR